MQVLVRSRRWHWAWVLWESGYFKYQAKIQIYLWVSQEFLFFIIIFFFSPLPQGRAAHSPVLYSIVIVVTGTSRINASKYKQNKCVSLHHIYVYRHLFITFFCESLPYISFLQLLHLICSRSLLQLARKQNFFLSYPEYLKNSVICGEESSCFKRTTLFFLQQLDVRLCSIPTMYFSGKEGASWRGTGSQSRCWYDPWDEKLCRSGNTESFLLSCSTVNSL